MCQIIFKRQVFVAYCDMCVDHKCHVLYKRHRPSAAPEERTFAHEMFSVRLFGYRIFFVWLWVDEDLHMQSAVVRKASPALFAAIIRLFERLMLPAQLHGADNISPALSDYQTSTSSFTRGFSFTRRWHDSDFTILFQ